LFNCFPPLPENEWRTLHLDVTNQEISQVVRSIGPFKAPGKDGLQAVFYIFVEIRFELVFGD